MRSASGWAGGGLLGGAGPLVVRPAPTAVTRAALLPLLVLLSLPSAQAALPDGFNHSEYRWKVLETAHFRVIYHQGMESTAEVTAREAEWIYPRVTAIMKVEPGDKTDIIVSDYTSVGIFAGSSYPLSHRIWLYGLTIYGARGDRDDVLRSVLYHEFVHICTYWAVRRGTFSTLWEGLNSGTLPGWLLEGLAEYVSEKAASPEPEAYDYKGDALVRAAVLEDDLTKLPGLAVEDWDDIYDISLTYRVGQSLVAYIAREFGGDGTLVRLLHEHSKFPLFDSACNEVLGIHEEELFSRWRDYTRQYYDELVAGRTDTAEFASRVAVPIQDVFGARWAPHGRTLAVLGYLDGEEYDLQLFTVRADGTGLTKAALELDQLRSTRFSWDPEGRRVVYSGFWQKSSGRVITGIWIYDTHTKQRRLVRDDIVGMDPAWSPDGQWIAFVLLRDAGTRHDLALMRPDGTGLRVITDTEQYPSMPEAAYSPSWSPDGTRLVCEVYDGPEANLGLLEADGSGYEMLTDDSDGNRFPAWSPDGRTIAFLCHHSQFTDLWSVDLATRTYRCHTSERVGQVTSPAWTPDSGGITVSVGRTRTAAAYTVPATRVIEELTAEQKRIPPEGDGTAETHAPGALEGADSAAKRDGRTEGTAAEIQHDARQEDVILRRYDYHSGDQFQTWILTPHNYGDNRGDAVGLLYRGADPLTQQNVRVLTSYGLTSRRGNLDVYYSNGKNRVSWEVSAFSHAPELGAFGGQRMLPQGTGGELRLGYSRAVGQSTYRREGLELAAHVENGIALTPQGGLAPIYRASGRLAYAEARWVRTRRMPTQGAHTLVAFARQGIPGLGQYPIQEIGGTYLFQHSSSGNRQLFTARLDAGAGRVSSWYGQPVSGGYLKPSLTYRFRIADDALPGLWPFLYPDRIEGRVTYQCVKNFGTPLYEADGHTLLAEVENRGYITRGLPYSLRVGAYIDTRNSSLAPVPYARFSFNIASF